MSNAEWICEPGDPLSAGWMCDAAWDVANLRHAHRQVVRSANGVGLVIITEQLFEHRLNVLLREVFHGKLGLGARFNTLDRNVALNAVNVIDAGGTGIGLRSIYLIGWGPRTAFMVSPDGIPTSTISGEFALFVADWRYVVRIANVHDGLSDRAIQNMMVQAKLKLPLLGDSERVRPMFYAGVSDLTEVEGIPVRVVPELTIGEERVQ